MIIPCEDLHDASKCKEKETVLIQKDYFDSIKGLDYKHQNYMGLLMDKSDIVKVEPDVLPNPESNTNPLFHIPHTDKTFIRYFRTNPTTIDEYYVYYQLVPFEPFILELGRRIKTTDTEITFKKIKKDTFGRKAYASETTIQKEDISNAEVLLIPKRHVNIFTKLKQHSSLTPKLIEEIREKIKNPNIKTSKSIGRTQSVSDLFGSTSPLSRSSSQPIIHTSTNTNTDFTTEESINSSSDSLTSNQSKSNDSSSIVTLDTSPESLSPPPPPPPPI